MLQPVFVRTKDAFINLAYVRSVVVHAKQPLALKLMLDAGGGRSEEIGVDGADATTLWEALGKVQLA